MDVAAKSGDSAFTAQVDALLATEASHEFPVTTVLVDRGSSRNTILDSGTESQVIANRTVNALRATPRVEDNHFE